MSQNGSSTTPRRPVWLIIGATSGIGQAIAHQVQPWATVIAAGRNHERLAELSKQGFQTLQLDMTSSQETFNKAVQSTVQHQGSIDVVVNAAGYLLEGAVEETSDYNMQHVFETNVFGPIRLSKALLPHMRRAGKGTIAHIAGIGGFRGAANAGVFCASKSALTTAIDALQQEVAPFGVQVCLVQLGHFRTPFLSDGHRRKVSGHIADYDPVLAPIRKAFDQFDGAQQGDPAKGAGVIIDALRSGEQVPFLLPVGQDVSAAELQAHEERASRIKSVQHLTAGTDIV